MEALIGSQLLDSQGNTLAFQDVITPSTKAIGLFFSGQVRTCLISFFRRVNLPAHHASSGASLANNLQRI